jgi:hypothetical protein
VPPMKFAKGFLLKLKAFRPITRSHAGLSQNRTVVLTFSARR